MAAKSTICRNCGYELPPEVDIGSGQKARMGSFGATCPICNQEINQPEEGTKPRPGFRPETSKASSKRKQGGQGFVGKKRKKRRKKRRR